MGRIKILCGGTVNVSPISGISELLKAMYLNRASQHSRILPLSVKASPIVLYTVLYAQFRGGLGTCDKEMKQCAPARIEHS